MLFFQSINHFNKLYCFISSTYNTSIRYYATIIIIIIISIILPNKFLTLFLLINYSLRVVVKFAIVTAFFHDMNSDVVVSRPPTTTTTETTSSIKIWLTRFTIACFFLSGGIEYSEWYDEISFHCFIVLVTDQLCLSRCHSPDVLGLYA